MQQVCCKSPCVRYCAIVRNCSAKFVRWKSRGVWGWGRPQLSEPGIESFHGWDRLRLEHVVDIDRSVVDRGPAILPARMSPHPITNRYSDVLTNTITNSVMF